MPGKVFKRERTDDKDRGRVSSPVFGGGTTQEGKKETTLGGVPVPLVQIVHGWHRVRQDCVPKCNKIRDTVNILRL